MDVHSRPSGIQVKATHFIQKVSHFRHKLKRNPHKFRDDSDLHPYSEHHRHAKSEAVDRQEDETLSHSVYKPYMSQPLLKLEEPLVPEVEYRTPERVRGARLQAGEAEPRALSHQLYGVQRPTPNRQLKHTILPVGPALSPLTNSTAPNNNTTGIKKAEQHVDLGTTGQGDNNMQTRTETSTKKQGLDDDDVPLMVLKQHGSKHNGRSTSMNLKKSATPDIVISSFDNDSARNGKKSGSDRVEEPVSRPISSSPHDHAIHQQHREAAPTLQPPPAAIGAARLALTIGTGSLSPLPSPSSVHPPSAASASSSSRPRISLVPLTPLSISPKLSRRISVDRDGNLLRFSPSLVTRHPALPLNLPPLPPVTPAKESSGIQDAITRKRNSQIGLRSMPSLSHSGTGQGAGGQEEEDGDEDEMDDIDEEAEESGHERSNTSHTDVMSLSSVGSEPSTRSHSEAPSFTTALGGVRQEANFRSDLPQVDTSALNFSFLDKPHPTSNYKGKGKAREDHFDEVPTPTKINGVGGASASKVLVPNTNKGATTLQAKRMSLGQGRTSGLASHSPQTGFATLKTLPLPPFADAERPGMYKRASQSMVDIHLLKPIAEHRRHDDPMASKVGNMEESPTKTTVVGEEIPPSPIIVRRRRSLPSYYGPSAPPPPYPTFPDWPLIQPREDEGKEKLPAYSNDIYLKSILPRKMEFSRPGHQARDRKWKRVICILEGTMLRVYRCSSRAAGVSVIEGWWERQTGVGDVSSAAASYVTATSIIRGPPMRSTEERRSVSPRRDGNKNEAQAQAMRSYSSATIRPSQQSVPPPETRRSKFIPFLRGRNHGRSSSDALPGTPRQRSPRGSLNLGSTGSTVSFHAPSPGPSSRSSMIDSGSSRSGSSVMTTDGEDIPEPKGSELIKCYTLQNAECGLGLDYVKRKNVIRVKMEGEQFLLQAKDAQEVVGWIEGIQSGTNVALDLDERAMPRGPVIPRWVSNGFLC